MNYFLDSSALIKRYVQEKETDAIQKVFDSADDVFISFIAELETVSALRRLLSETKITDQQFDNFLFEFDQDLEDYIIVPLDFNVKKLARKLIQKHQIKTLDSIQLASYISLKSDDISFIVYDEKLFNTAIKESCNAIKPS